MLEEREYTMPRSDGKLVKNIPAIERLIPHIMNRRYDATNYAKIEFETENLQKFLRNLRVQGHNVGIMDAVICAYVQLLHKRPELNRFIANKKIYDRKYIAVAFNMIRYPEDGQVEETVIKIYVKPEDGLLEISQKIRQAIKENEKPQSKNAIDTLMDKLVMLPFLPGSLVWLIKWADRRGILPKKIIELSPFHSSLYLSNLASIQMDAVYHHLYDFGTTSVFCTIGKPKRSYHPDGSKKQTMALGFSMDERICIGAIWVKSLFEFRRMLEQPENLLSQKED